MKKLIIGALLLIMSSTVQAKEKSVTTTVVEKASAMVDSGKKAVSNAVETADTSGNFRMIYNDVKTGINALASSLKVGAEHVYIVLVKQQVIYAMSYLVICLLLATVAIVLWRGFLRGYGHLMNKEHEWYNDEIQAHDTLVARLVVAIIMSIAGSIMTGLLNPEYGAMQDIMDMVNH